MQRGRLRRLLDEVQGGLEPLPWLPNLPTLPALGSGQACWDAGEAAPPTLLGASFAAPEPVDAMPPIPAVMPGVDLPALVPLRDLSTAGES